MGDAMKLIITDYVGNSLNIEKNVTTLVIAPFDTGSGAIPKSLIKAKGEIVVGTGDGQVTNLAAPTPGYVLTGSATEDEGVTWAPGAGGAVENDVVDFRLTLTSGTPVPTADQTAKTVVYLTPTGQGNRISLYSGSWAKRDSAEISIKLTDSQNGNTTNGSKVVTGLSDTTQMIAGMAVSGTGIAAGSAIATVDSPTQVTLDKNATADGTGVSLTFKVPAGKNVDVFAWDNAGTVKLEFGPLWTNDTTRATALALQDGVYSKTGDTTRRYLGTVRTTAVDGQTEDSYAKRLVWNYYNRTLRTAHVANSTSHTYATTTLRVWNNDATIKADFVIGLADTLTRLHMLATLAAATQAQFWIILDANISLMLVGYTSSIGAAMQAANSGVYALPVGYHSIHPAEFASGTCTFAYAYVGADIYG